MKNENKYATNKTTNFLVIFERLSTRKNIDSEWFTPFFLQRFPHFFVSFFLFFFLFFCSMTLVNEIMMFNLL